MIQIEKDEILMQVSSILRFCQEIVSKLSSSPATSINSPEPAINEVNNNFRHDIFDTLLRDDSVDDAVWSKTSVNDDDEKKVGNVKILWRRIFHVYEFWAGVLSTMARPHSAMTGGNLYLVLPFFLIFFRVRRLPSADIAKLIAATLRIISSLVNFIKCFV